MSEALYTSRIIKASALIPDTWTLLAEWDLQQDTAANLDHARRTNIFGKASRSRVEDVLRIFRQRYFDDPEIGGALVRLVQGQAPAQWVEPLIYYYSVMNDETLRAIVLQVVYERKMAGYADITPEHVQRALRDWAADGKTSGDWGEITILRIAQNALAALRDFGVLQGKASKSITPIYLPVESSAFLAFEMGRGGKSGPQILTDENWRLFFLPLEGVERFFLEAHQERLLSYHAAGSIVRLEFPMQTLAEVADALVERARAQA